MKDHVMNIRNSSMRSNGTSSDALHCGRSYVALRAIAAAILGLVILPSMESAVVGQDNASLMNFVSRAPIGRHREARKLSTVLKRSAIPVEIQNSNIA